MKSSFTGAASLARTLIDAARQSVFGCFGVFGCGVDGWPAGSALSIEGFAAAIAFDIHFQDRWNETVDWRDHHGIIGEEFAPFSPARHQTETNSRLPIDHKTGHY